jgi:hypothetical protein
MVTKLTVILVLAASTAVTYALQHRQTDPAPASVEGVEYVTITAKPVRGAE